MLKQHQEISYRELVDALRTLCQEGSTGHMFICTDSNHSARIALTGGAITTVTFGRFQGQEAIDAIRKIGSARFSFSEVTYDGRSRRALPPTDVILAQLAEDAWLGESPRGGLETGGGAAGGGEADIEGSIFAAAQRSVDEEGEARTGPFGRRPGGGVSVKGKGIAERLRMLRRAGRSARPEADEHALARELFGASSDDVEHSRREVADSARSGKPLSLEGLPGAAEAKPDSTADAAAQDLFAAAAGAEEGLSADDNALARQVFGARDEDSAAARTSGPDETLAEDLSATSAGGVETGDHRIAAVESPGRDGRGDDAGGVSGPVLDEGDLFRAALSEGGAESPLADESVADEDADIARTLLVGDADDTSGTVDDSAHGFSLGSMSGSQRVFGPALVDLIRDHLTKSLGPAASLAVAEIEEQIKQVSRAADLEAILWRLSERIDDPEAAFSFHTAVMETAFG